MPDYDAALTADGDDGCKASPAELVRKPRCWFEVEDVLRHFDHFKHVTGIQRVSLEIFRQVERLYGATGRIGFCRLNLMTQEFEEVQFSEIMGKYLCPPGNDAPWHAFDLLVKRGSKMAALETIVRLPRYLKRSIFPSLAQWIGRRLRPARPAHFLRPDDVIICLGACWINRRYNQCIEAAKRDYRVRFVLLIHDLIPLTHASFVDRHHSATFSKWIADALATVDFALTVSRHSRDELIKVAKAHAWSLPLVEVLPLGATFKPWGPRKTVNIPAASGALPRRFVLYVSTIEPRKNHRLLIEVWRRLIARHGADVVPDLVWVGVSPARAFRREILSGNDFGDKLHLLTELSDEELVEAYRRCLFTVYPSLCEGWGLPVAESLAHGRFCVASDCTSLPEVGGRFVDYFNPADIDDAVAKIERPLLDPTYLAKREALLRDAYKPAPWPDCARSLMLMLDRAVVPVFSQEARP